VLRARLLGGLEVELDGAVIDSPASQRPWAVFAYLALAPRPVPRIELASKFWPDVLDQSARASLRSVLWALRRELGARVAAEHDHVELRDEQGLWIDVREFERLAVDDADAALALCRGELLQGVEDDWALLARERHRERVIELLEQSALRAEEDGDIRAAIGLTREQVERDPFDEAAHRRLMERLAQAGDRAGAMRAHRALAERLRRELGVAPSAPTRELAEALRAEAPVAQSAPGPSPIAGMAPLIGRARELAELEGTWQGVAEGSGAAAVIRGDAGIGKTRLASELRERAGAAGARTAACAALDLGGTAPLSLWAELIRELLPALPAPPAEAAWPDDLAVLAPELPAHFARGPAHSSTIAPDLQRTRLFEAVVSLLGFATRESPLLLLLEDVHSADASSLELAGYAARRLAGLPIMMVMTRRELPHSANADQLEHALRARGLLACELDLGPLGASHVTALARQAASLSDGDLERVVRSAEGNALLAVETARALGRGHEDVAPSLRGSVRATLSPLSGDVRKLIEVVAVAARPVERAEIAELELEDAEQGASDALQTSLLVATDGGIGFRHALLREAVYEEIAAPRRRGMHQGWANALIASERAGATAHPAEVARHLRLAGADRDAVPHLVSAAADARALAALEQAVIYLEEALGIAPERPELWLELGELEAWRGRREPAERAFEHALALLADEPPLSRARAWLRRMRAYHGPICVPRAVLESANNALELLAGAGVPAQEERRAALAARVWAEAVAGDVDEAERLLAELSSDPQQNDDLQIYDVGHARALALMRRGQFIASYAPSIAAGEAITRAGRPDLAYGCWANVACAATAAGEHERALEFLDRGTAAMDGHGLRTLETHMLAARSFVLRRLDRLEEARAVAEAECALAEELAQPELAAMASHDRGVVALEAGEYELAGTLLAQSLVDGAPISRHLARMALAEALARGGQPEQAAEQVRATVLEPVRPSDFPNSLVPMLARVQGLIALANGQHEEASRRLEESVAGWERLLARGSGAEGITTVLADLGRPVVGIVEPARELARARADLAAVPAPTKLRRDDAVVS
jgi:DNA-binding SARP family transcriptional activator